MNAYTLPATNHMPTGDRDERCPADAIATCDCGVRFRAGGAHHCHDLGRRVAWDDWLDTDLAAPIEGTA